MKTTNFIIIVFFSSLFLFTTNCLDTEKIGQDGNIKSPKFHTLENEGKWLGKSDTHMPSISFIDSEKTRIRVHVPVMPKVKPRRHYIEKIILMQGERTQIEVKNIPVKRNQPIVEFTLPNPEATDYWILVKCNVHGMWKGPVQTAK